MTPKRGGWFRRWRRNLVVVPPHPRERDWCWDREMQRQAERLDRIDAGITDLKRGSNPFVTAVTHRDQETP